MSSSWCFWTFSPLLLLLGRNLGVLIEIHQDSVNGTVDQAVLLPVSYRFDGAPHFPVSISWTFSNNLDVLITCTIENCSWGAAGAPSNCFAKYFLHEMYRDRAEFFPQNGSLLLHNLKLNDSGVYSVKLSYQTRNGTIRQIHQTRNITLTVHERRFSPGQAADYVEQGYIHNIAIGICSSASLLLLLLLLCCLRHRGAAQQQKRKITEQQQVSGVEESHVEGTERGVATIYATIDGGFEQPPPRPTLEVVYASITSPDPPRLNTGHYHFLV